MQDKQGWVKKFRDSQTFGRGSCTTVDEAMTDAELLEDLQRFGSFKEAWDFYVEIEEIHWERCGIPWKPKKEG